LHPPVVARRSFRGRCSVALSSGSVRFVGWRERAGRLVGRHQFDISLAAVLLVLHLVGFGQSPGLGLPQLC
jgi:hypothetical protein